MATRRKGAGKATRAGGWLQGGGRAQTEGTRSTGKASWRRKGLGCVGRRCCGPEGGCPARDLQLPALWGWRVTEAADLGFLIETTTMVVSTLFPANSSTTGHLRHLLSFAPFADLLAESLPGPLCSTCQQRSALRAQDGPHGRGPGSTSRSAARGGGRALRASAWTAEGGQSVSRREPSTRLAGAAMCSASPARSRGSRPCAGRLPLSARRTADVGRPGSRKGAQGLDTDRGPREQDVRAPVRPTPGRPAGRCCVPPPPPRRPAVAEPFAALALVRKARLCRHGDGGLQGARAARVQAQAAPAFVKRSFFSAPSSRVLLSSGTENMSSLETLTFTGCSKF